MGYAWRWRLVGSADREVAGNRSSVTHVGPMSGRRLEILRTSGRCMRGAWKSGGSWQRSAGTATRRWQSRLGRCPNVHRAWSFWETGTVALGRAQFGAQCCFAIIQTLHRFQNTKWRPSWCPKIIETWHGARVDPSKQFLPLGPLPILNRIQVIKLGTTPLWIFP
jgi:hypothetical protein